MAAMTQEIVIVMVVVVVMMPRMVPVRIVPAPMEAVPIIGTVPIVVIVPGIVVPIIIGIIVVSVVAVRVKAPVPRIIYKDVGVAAASVIVVIIIERGAGAGSETLDARSKVGIVVGLGGGIDHAVGVGYRLGGLIHGLGIRHIVLAVGIIGLVVVGAAAVDARRHRAAIAAVSLAAWRVVRRIIGVVIGHPLL